MKILLISTLLLILVIQSCFLFKDSTLDRIKKEKLLRVGYANEIPYAFMDLDGALTGEAPVIAREILGKMGEIRMEGIFSEFGSLIPNLKSGRIDMIAAGMFITPERCKQISFSDPTYRIGQAFLVKKGNPKRLHSYADVANHKSAILCVMSGAIEKTYAKQTPKNITANDLCRSY